MVLGQKMRWIFLRLVMLEDDRLARPCLVIGQHSDPYTRVIMRGQLGVKTNYSVFLSLQRGDIALNMYV